MTETPQCKHKDSASSFEELYDTHFSRVNRYLRYRVKNTWDADDLTAIVFMKALEKYHTFRGQSSVASWLFRIAHNAFVDYMRGLPEPSATEMYLHKYAAPQKTPEEQMLLNEEVFELRSLLSSLPPDYRDVMSLRYAGELRFAQIAEVLGKTGAAVRMIHFRGLRMLRKRFKHQWPMEIKK